MNIIEKIKDENPLEQYAEKIIGKYWKQIGLWKDIDECPFCFIEGTMVLTSSGFKPIEKIKTNEKVLTNDGNFQKIVKTYRRIFTGEFIKIKVGGIETITTYNHPFETLTSPYCYFKFKKLEKRNWRLRCKEDKCEWKCKNKPIRQEKLINANELKEREHSLKIPFLPVKKSKIDPALAWLLGIWVAEGSISGGRCLQFALHFKEDYYSKRILSICKSMNLSAKEYPGKPINTVRTVIIYNAKFTRWVKNICGKGAGGKFIPKTILFGSREIQKAFIQGWFDGDGYYRQKKNRNVPEYKLTTISKRLAMEGYLIASNLGWVPTFTKQQPQFKLGIVRKPIYHLTLFPQGRKKKRVVNFKNNTFAEIDSIQKFQDTRIVYNLQVENNHFYIANGFSVHNCGGHSCFRLSPTGSIFCFQCRVSIHDSIKFRAVWENITYKESIDKFREDMGIKKYERKEIDWISLRESACEYLTETLFTCPTKYTFRNQEYTPVRYLTDYRKHSYDAILNFRLGFNDGGLVDHLNKEFKKDVVEASGLNVIPNGSFTYPVIVNGDIKFFRIKNPNRRNCPQMRKETRSRDALWYNQDCIQESGDLVLVEGEDDVVSLWESGENAVGCIGMLTLEQINYIKDKNVNSVYSAFDSDSTGRRDANILMKNYQQENLFIFQLPNDKDIDEVLRETDEKRTVVEDLKFHAETPSPEMKTPVTQKPEGYYISKISQQGGSYEKRLTNWTLKIEAVIIRDDERIRKVRIRAGDYEETVYIPSVFSSVPRLREFLLDNCNRLLYFQGNDADLSCLVQYWEVAFKPKVVKESDCVGEIDEGFIGENIFISNNNEFKPLTNGFLSLDDKHSIKIVELVKKGGARSEIPFFPLTEPAGGIQEFKKDVYGLMVKNRNLKIAFGIGWLKATLWSKMFYSQYKWFPILLIHGKYQSGKTVFANWLMSMIGMRDCLPEVLSRGGTSEVGLSRKLAYYSSLPVFVDEYGKDEEIAHNFHTFFRGIFNRSSGTKGVKDDFGVRRVVIRGCLLIAGEYSPTDAALSSRLVSVELTSRERTLKPFTELRRLEPKFATIGLQWVKDRIPGYKDFIAKYERIEPLLSKGIDDPRQASVWSVAVAGALTEPYFKEDDLLQYAVKLANYEIQEHRGEEIIGSLWQAVDILDKKSQLLKQCFHYRGYDKTLEVHLPGLLGEIQANPSTRNFKLPNHREVAKILKEEPYVLELKNTRIDEKVAKRWILDIKKCPAILKDMYESEEENKQQENLDI